MKVIAVTATKGGVGKSTIARVIACGLAQTKRNYVALIDADPQGSQMKWSQLRNADTPIVTKIETTQLISKIAELRKEDALTHLVIDTSPSQSALNADIMRAADLVIFPTTPADDDMMAMPNFRDEFVQTGTPGLAIINKASTESGRGKLAMRDLEKYFPEILICRTGIRTYACIADAAGQGLSHIEAEPSNKNKPSASDNALSDLKKVMNHIKKELK